MAHFAAPNPNLAAAIANLAVKATSFTIKATPAPAVINVAKAPKAVPNIKNPPTIAGQKSLINLPIASIFFLFSLSVNQSINFIKTLAKRILVKASHIALKILVTGANTFFIGAAMKDFTFSFISSLFFLFSSSNLFLSLSASSLSALFSPLISAISSSILSPTPSKS